MNQMRLFARVAMLIFWISVAGCNEVSIGSEAAARKLADAKVRECLRLDRANYTGVNFIGGARFEQGWMFEYTQAGYICTVLVTPAGDVEMSRMAY